VLTTVPTVRGVDLTVDNLLEFLQRIEAGGAAAGGQRPPAIQRILSSKVREAVYMCDSVCEG
jgi:hypothetical protein